MAMATPSRGFERDLTVDVRVIPLCFIFLSNELRKWFIKVSDFSFSCMVDDDAIVFNFLITELVSINKG